MHKIMIAASAALLAVAPLANAGEIRSSVDAAGLKDTKTTPLGLYLTPKDAHAALQADASIVFVDVRDPIEVAFVGHAEGMDGNIPVKLATHRFDAAEGDCPLSDDLGHGGGFRNGGSWL